ncbi:hypothetical protein Q3G72_008687 [Acer saccharum]|nr:hypothetical protein Q3G72_008687 [Acer saccharum]
MSVSFELSPVDSFDLSPSYIIECAKEWVERLRPEEEQQWKDEAKDLDKREVALRAKETQQGQKSEESQSHSMANNGEDVSYVPRVQTSKNTVDLCGMRVEEAAHQLIDMVISGTDSQSVVFVIHGMGTWVVKEHALELWVIVFAFWENTSGEGIGLKLCKMIFGSRPYSDDIVGMDKSGRRPLLMVSAAGTCLGCLLTALSFFLQDLQQWKDGTPFLALVGVLVYTGSFSLGMGGIPWVIMSEVDQRLELCIV